MLVWLTLPFYDFCSFRSVAVNSVHKLQFFTFIFAVLLPVLNRLLIMSINTTFFDLSWWRRSAILDFENFEISTDGLVQRANMCHHTKCCADRSNRYQVVFLGRRPPPSWISLNFKLVTDQTVTRAELRHTAKFRWNHWNCGQDMTIFQNGDRRHVGFLKLQISNCDASYVSDCGTMPNFGGDRSNRCRDISILDSSRWQKPPSWIFKILNF